MRKIRQITNHLDFRVPGNRKIIIHNDAAGPVSWCAESFPNERRIIAGRPNFHTARNKFIADLHASFSEICCPRAYAHFHAQIRELFPRALR